MKSLKFGLLLTTGAVLLLFGVAFSQPTNPFTFWPDVEVTEAPPEDGVSQIFFSSGQHYTAFRGDTVYVVWWEARSSTPPIGNHVLFAKSTDGGQTFGPNVRVNNLSSAFNPSMKVDTAGVVYVAYQSSADIYFSKSTDGGTSFTSGVKVNDDTIPQIGQELPAIAVNNKGQVFIAWRDQRTAPGEPHQAVFAAVSYDGGATFTANVQVNDTATPLGGSIDIGTGDSGRVYVVWMPNRRGIILSRSDDSCQTFSVRTEVADVPTDSTVAGSGMQSIAVGNGIIGVVWKDRRFEQFTLRFSYSNDFGQTFSPSIRIDDDSNMAGTSAPSVPSLVWRDSVFYVCWNETRIRPSDSAMVRNIWFSYLPAGGMTFVKVVDVNAPDATADPLHAHALSSIAVNEGGKIFVAWMDNRYETMFNSRMHVFGAIADTVLIKGDLNLDRLVTVTDVVLELNAVFAGLGFPARFEAADGNCDSELTPGDIVLLLAAVFAGNSFPCAQTAFGLAAYEVV